MRSQPRFRTVTMVNTAQSLKNSMIEPFEEDFTTALVLKMLIRKPNLQTYFYNGLLGHIVMRKARYVARGFEQDLRVGFTEVHDK